MFWALMFFLTAAISILFVSPVPLLGCLVIWGFARPFEEPQEAIIKEAGRNPALPPTPNTDTGLAGCLAWLLCMGMVLLFVAAVAGGILYGGGA